MDGECQREEMMSVGGHRIVTIDGFEDVPPNNELALKKAVSKCVVCWGACGGGVCRGVLASVEEGCVRVEYPGFGRKVFSAQLVEVTPG